MIAWNKENKEKIWKQGLNIFFKILWRQRNEYIVLRSKIKLKCLWLSTILQRSELQNSEDYLVILDGNKTAIFAL